MTHGTRSFRCAPFPRLTPPTFCQPWSCYASPYPGWQNVVNLERYTTFEPRIFLGCIKNHTFLNRKLENIVKITSKRLFSLNLLLI